MTYKFFVKSASAAGICAAGLWLAGCSGKTASEPVSTTENSDAAAEETVVPYDAINEVYFKVDDLILSGKTNEANSVFAEAIEKEEFAPAKADMFAAFMRYLAWYGQIDEAKTRYMNMLRTDEDTARPGFDFIYAYLLENEGDSAAFEWAKVLASEPISADLRFTAGQWLVEGFMKSGDFAGMSESLSSLMDPEFSSEQRARILMNTAAYLADSTQDGASDALDKVRAAAGAASTASPEDKWLVTASNVIDVYKSAAGKDWKAVCGTLKDAASSSYDMPLLKAFVFAANTAKEAGDFDAVDAVCEAVLSAAAGDNAPRTHNNAARSWVANVFKKNGGAGKAEFPSRLSSLEAKGVKPRQVYLIFSVHFYDVANDADIVAECIPLCEGLLPKLDDEVSAGIMKQYLLDAYYLTKNYDKVLEMLQSGMPDRDEAWTKMTMAKVKADKALEQKDYDAAVANFREFIECVKASEEDNLSDPTSGVIYTKDMITAKNLKRIGDIQKEAGKPEADVKASYNEARKLYKGALEAKDDLNSETVDYINAALKEIPE